MSLVFFAGGSEREVSLLIAVVKAVVGSEAISVSGEADRFRDGEGGLNVVRAWTTSAIVFVQLKSRSYNDVSVEKVLRKRRRES